ncbi:MULTISPECIES: ACT domain-containing protein [unclassified Caulobacter]|uniref:ACT domain-containing protein n=1 Tax=unclassified Caulobacter TaxID=2648921 RepID=UPI000D3A4B19|nr:MULTISPECIES: ACT domain-containing protein [unclassified Caulobacter]PTS89184.1 hypothetical protein DBR21_07215 [Caulobacter sp. HMWF009]PTT09997.1 hypothetical protein DBR10_06275 [Caulobacter sp. HMWF025]
MIEVIQGTRDMVAGLEPELRPGRFVFCQSPHETWWDLKPIAMFQESEGVSLILEEGRACAAGIASHDVMGLITLNVYSALTGVGLTASVSSALAAAGIACNMVAALSHDHVFVPYERTEEALAILRKLQASVP